MTVMKVSTNFLVGFNKTSPKRLQPRFEIQYPHRYWPQVFGIGDPETAKSTLYQTFPLILAFSDNMGINIDIGRYFKPCL